MKRADNISGRRETAIAVGLLVLSALAIALMPNLSKLAFADGSNPGTVVIIRTVTAVLLLAMIMLARQRSFRLPAAVLALAVLATVSNAAMNYSFLSSVFRMDVSLTILILFIHPFLVAFYFHADGTARLTAFRMAWALLAFIGLALALAVPIDNVSKSGLLFAGISAAACTVMVIAMVKVNAQVGGVTTNFHMAFWSLMIFSVALLWTQDVQLPNSILGWASSASSGVAYVVAFLAYLSAVRLIGPSRATILTFMEPLGAILLAAALFGERLTGLQWAGVTLVLGGLFFMEANMPLRRKRARAAQ